MSRLGRGFVGPERASNTSHRNPNGSSEDQTTPYCRRCLIASGQRLERNAAGDAQNTPVNHGLVSPRCGASHARQRRSRIQLSLPIPSTLARICRRSQCQGTLRGGTPPSQLVPARCTFREAGKDSTPAVPQSGYEVYQGDRKRSRQLSRRGEEPKIIEICICMLAQYCMTVFSCGEKSNDEVSHDTFDSHRPVPRLPIFLCCQFPPDPTAPVTVPPQDQTAPRTRPRFRLNPRSLKAQPRARHGRQILLINTTERLKRISVTDPSIATVRVITPTQILVHGLAPANLPAHLDENERSRSSISVLTSMSAPCAEEERRVFPDEQISVSPSRAPSFCPDTSLPRMLPSAPENWPPPIPKCNQRAYLRSRGRAGSSARGKVRRGRSLRPYSTRSQRLSTGAAMSSELPPPANTAASARPLSARRKAKAPVSRH